MLSNAYFLAKFRFDTAENEPAKNLQNFRKMHFRKMHFRKIHFSKNAFSKDAFSKNPFSMLTGAGAPLHQDTVDESDRGQAACDVGQHVVLIRG